jgi:hypothetical protein
MIDYKELRIGNWIRQSKRSVGVDSNEFDCQVNEINAKGLNVGHGGVYLEWQFCEGIPFSEEVLVKCGFESNPYQDRYENKAIHIECNKLRGETELWIDRMPHVKYLHQLQNLVFALTGEELIYNPA